MLPGWQRLPHDRVLPIHVKSTAAMQAVLYQNDIPTMSCQSHLIDRLIDRLTAHHAQHTSQAWLTPCPNQTSCWPNCKQPEPNLVVPLKGAARAHVGAGQLAQQLSTVPYMTYHNNRQCIDKTCCALPLTTPIACQMHKMSSHTPHTQLPHCPNAASRNL